MISDDAQKISVIVPVYKAEAYLGPCIDSILSQTWENFELLLIDDGSPDASGSICDDYARKDPRITVFHRQNQGVSRTRNFGMEQAAGTYLLFIDADDLIAPDYMEKLHAALQGSGEDVISLCGFRYLKEGLYSERREPLSDYTGDPGTLCSQYLEPLVTGQIQGACWRVLYPVELLRKNHIAFTQCKIAEDLLFFMEVISCCKGIRVCPESLYSYRLFPQSSSHRTYITGYLPDRLHYLEELNRIFSRAPLEEEQRRWLLSFSFQFYRMLLYMNATAAENPRQELAQINATVFGTRKVPRDQARKFASLLKKNHRVLNFLVAHRLFALIPLLRSLSRARG